MGHQKKLTVKTVAGILGVSVATVSNAFNRPDQLSAKLREHILRECDKLGYHGPNAAARSLRTGYTGVVGVMLAEKLSYNFSDPCALEFLQGVSQVLDEAQYNMLLMPGREGFYSEKSLEGIPDRYILYGPPNDLDIVKRIERQKKPVVTVDFDLVNHLALNIDNYGGAKLAAQHVLERTSGPVAVIGLRLIDSGQTERIGNQPLLSADIAISRLRLEGYLEAAKAAGRPISPNFIWSTHTSNWQEGICAAREALALEPRPEALLCMSDQLALAAIAAAREANLKIPEELKIVGFDDIDAATKAHPTLTSVRQYSVEKGRLAAQMVLDPTAFESKVLPTSLQIRETTQLFE